MDDPVTPGWSVVLKKEARGKRIHSTELDHVLGQEESHGDREVLSEMSAERGESGDGHVSAQALEVGRNGRRRHQ